MRTGRLQKNIVTNRYHVQLCKKRVISHVKFFQLQNHKLMKIMI